MQTQYRRGRGGNNHDNRLQRCLSESERRGIDRIQQLNSGLNLPPRWGTRRRYRYLTMEEDFYPTEPIAVMMIDIDRFSLYNCDHDVAIIHKDQPPRIIIACLAEVIDFKYGYTTHISVLDDQVSLIIESGLKPLARFSLDRSENIDTVFEEVTELFSCLHQHYIQQQQSSDNVDSVNEKKITEVENEPDTDSVNISADEELVSQQAKVPDLFEVYIDVFNRLRADNGRDVGSSAHSIMFTYCVSTTSIKFSDRAIANMIADLFHIWTHLYNIEHRLHTEVKVVAGNVYLGVVITKVTSAIPTRDPGYTYTRQDSDIDGSISMRLVSETTLDDSAEKSYPRNVRTASYSGSWFSTDWLRKNVEDELTREWKCQYDQQPAQTTDDSTYCEIGFREIVEDIPNTSLSEIIDWVITFEDTVVYKLSESNDDDTILDRLKKAVEFRYPFIRFNVAYDGRVSESDIPQGYVTISTIPNVTRQLIIDVDGPINLPYNLAENTEFFLSVNYTPVCKELNQAIEKVLKHCCYNEVQ